MEINITYRSSQEQLTLPDMVAVFPKRYKSPGETVGIMRIPWLGLGLHNGSMSCVKDQGRKVRFPSAMLSTLRGCIWISTLVPLINENRNPGLLSWAELFTPRIPLNSLGPLCESYPVTPILTLEHLALEECWGGKCVFLLVTPCNTFWLASTKGYFCV